MTHPSPDPKPIIGGEHLDLISALRGQVFLIESHEESGGSPSNAKFMRDAFEYLERYKGVTPAELAQLRETVAKLSMAVKQYKINPGSSEHFIDLMEAVEATAAQEARDA